MDNPLLDTCKYFTSYIYIYIYHSRYEIMQSMPYRYVIRKNDPNYDFLNLSHYNLPSIYEIYSRDGSIYYFSDHFQYLQLLVVFPPNKIKSCSSWMSNVVSQMPTQEWAEWWERSQTSKWRLTMIEIQAQDYRAALLEIHRICQNNFGNNR